MLESSHKAAMILMMIRKRYDKVYSMIVLCMNLTVIVTSNSLLPSMLCSARKKRPRNMPAASKPSAMQKLNPHGSRPRTDAPFPPQSPAPSAPHLPASENPPHQALSGNDPSHGALLLVPVWRYLGKGAKAHGA